jgi:ketosteroid isomerase-like protein
VRAVYHALVKRTARSTYEALSRGDYEDVVKSFAPDALLFFAGDHALGGTFRGDAIRGWFERLFACFPDLKLQPQTIVVEGFPWNTSVATRFQVTATLPLGKSYTNAGMQLLRIRWGRIVEDRIYEDTQVLAAALGQLHEAGVAEAAEQRV